MRGIPHIEDLTYSHFLDVVENLHEYTVTEKVDGSNLHFGLDDVGFYTSREHMGGSRCYHDSEYPRHFSTTYMRIAHSALQQSLDAMIDEAGLEVGDRVEVEVLYGITPNVVPYDREQTAIVFLRTVEGSVECDALARATSNVTNIVTLDEVPTTPIKMHNMSFIPRTLYSTKIVPVEFAGVEVKHISSQPDEILQQLIAKLKRDLAAPSSVCSFSVLEVLEIPLNRRPTRGDPTNWKTIKKQLATARLTYNEIFIKQKMDIKERLLNTHVRSKASQFWTNIKTINDSWIEGVVFRHPATGEQFKLVDKQVFTMIKNFIWDERESVTKLPAGINDTNTGIMGDFMLALGSAINDPILGTTQAKKILRTHGDTGLKVIENYPCRFDFNEAKSLALMACYRTIALLEQGLVDFENDLINESIYVPTLNRTIKHTKDSIERTVQTYSVCAKRAKDLLYRIEVAPSPRVLFAAVMFYQLSEL